MINVRDTSTSFDNRCAEVVKKDWPDFELTKAFFDERKNKYLAE